MENQDQGTAARTLGQAASALASPISRGLHQLVCVAEPNPPALRCELEGWTSLGLSLTRGRRPNLEIFYSRQIRIDFLDENVRMADRNALC